MFRRRVAAMRIAVGLIAAVFKRDGRMTIDRLQTPAP
jgi:hypothetical protein